MESKVSITEAMNEIKKGVGGDAVDSIFIVTLNDGISSTGVAGIETSFAGPRSIILAAYLRMVLETQFGTASAIAETIEHDGFKIIKGNPDQKQGQGAHDFFNGNGPKIIEIRADDDSAIANLIDELMKGDA